MHNRESTKPGRVLLEREDGSESYYAYLSRADEPTNEGTALNEETLFKKTTAAHYGLDENSVPDDAFWLLSKYIPSPYGLIIIQVVAPDGEPTAASLAVSPSVEGVSEIAVSGNGFCSMYAKPGAYKLSNPSASSAYQTLTPASMEITVEAGKPVVAKFIAVSSDSGELDFTSSGTFVVPDWMTSIDIFAVGGGASGCAHVYKGGYGRSNIGGGGGYTKSLLKQNLAGKTLTINIGSGGPAVTVSNAGASYDSETIEVGNDGGKTSVSVDGIVLLSAPGGKGGSTHALNDQGSGGSGGGWKGGSDGGDGTSESGESQGAGQGTTTRKFGESSGELLSGGGGGASTSTGVGSGAGGSGGGGSGNFKKLSAAANSYHYGGNATKAGGGGGSVLVQTNTSGVSLAGETAVSGKGYRGLVSIRW